MSRTHEESKQLDAEIKLCIEQNGPLSGYRITKCTQAPPMTIHYKLKMMVKRGELNCKKKGKAILYSLPLTVADLPEAKRELAPKMVSRGPKALTENTLRSEDYLVKRYSSGRQRRSKSLAAMAFEGNGEGRR
ncbi:MAG: hypothetical protein GX421_11370 [Caldisericales bacterium]|jgi:hypothetical protein|nr:hypothetical protein [Caldisericales bacterium]